MSIYGDFLRAIFFTVFMGSISDRPIATQATVRTFLSKATPATAGMLAIVGSQQ
jgi:hypothetical protein